MNSTPLVAVAHGSRDPRSAATIADLVALVREQAPGLDARAAFLDLSEPSVPDVLGELHAEGHRAVTVVPLLLGTAFHARVDLPALVDEVRGELPMLDVSVSPVLGPDALMRAALRARLDEAGATAAPDLGVVVAGVGSAHAPANAVVARLARRLQHGGEYAGVTHAFATTGPGIRTAIARLRARGARRIAVAPWFLAPGLLLDQLISDASSAAENVTLAAPLGAHPLVADVVLQRYARVGVAAQRAA